MAKYYGEDLYFKQDVVTIQKYKKQKELAKLKTWKGGLGNKEHPGGL